MTTPEPEKKKEMHAALIYSGLGFQIAGTIGVGVLIGYELDKWLEPTKHYYTIGFSFLFVFLALFVAFRGLLKK